MTIIYKAIKRSVTTNIFSHFHLISRSKTYYITTPIFYVNSVPHIGHLYTTTLADTGARWQKLRTGKPTMLATGTDEHGLKIFKSAQDKKVETKLFCDQVSQKFKDMCTTFNIENNDFIRTTEERHIHAVEHFWEVLKDRGYIYKGSYEGWYSTPDECFFGSNQIEQIHDEQTGQTQHISKETGHKLEWTSESNYMFKVSEVVDELKEFLRKNPNFVRPERYYNDLMLHFEKPISDISISREQKRVPWGIPVPGDHSQTIYVWFDALINYLTVAGYPRIESPKFKQLWPADVHIVGMDILKFHALYWPAFLIAAGIELPKQIICHAHWTSEGQKMSKSIGNVVDPIKTAQKVTPEGLKYFLLKRSDLGYDANFCNALLYNTINTDFSNTIGNCLHRSTAKLLNPTNTYLGFHAEYFTKEKLGFTLKLVNVEALYEFINLIHKLPESVDENAINFQFGDSLEKIIEAVRSANLLIQQNELWHFNKDNQDEVKVRESVLYCVYEGLRVCGILLQTYTPKLACKMLDKLSISSENRTWNNAKKSFTDISGIKSSHVGKSLEVKKEVLFKRLIIPPHLKQTVEKDKKIISKST